MVHPSRPKGELEIELRPPKNNPVDLHVKVCVGPAGADLLQVLNEKKQNFQIYSNVTFFLSGVRNDTSIT